MIDVLHVVGMACVCVRREAPGYALSTLLVPRTADGSRNVVTPASARSRLEALGPVCVCVLATRVLSMIGK
jgi:hypothetical protein